MIMVHYYVFDRIILKKSCTFAFRKYRKKHEENSFYFVAVAVG